MPKYRVISVADGSIPVCVLMARNERGRIDALKVKDMEAENAAIFIGKDILVGTTNREIIPQDILFETGSHEGEVELPERTVKYRVLSAADGGVPVCTFTVHDEEGRMDHLHVHDMTAENAAPFVGEEIFVTVQNKEIRPRDIKVKKYEIFPTPPMDEYDEEEEEDVESRGDARVLIDEAVDAGVLRMVEDEEPEGLYWCERCGRRHKYTSKIGLTHLPEAGDDRSSI